MIIGNFFCLINKLMMMSTLYFTAFSFQPHLHWRDFFWKLNEKYYFWVISPEIVLLSSGTSYLMLLMGKIIDFLGPVYISITSSQDFQDFILLCHTFNSNFFRLIFTLHLSPISLLTVCHIKYALLLGSTKHNTGLLT